MTRNEKNHRRRASVAERGKNHLHKAISKLFYVTTIFVTLSSFTASAEERFFINEKY